MRFAAVFAILPMLIAAPAWADGPIATNDPNAAPPPVSTATPAPLPNQAGAVTPIPAAEVMGPCGPEKILPNGKPDQSAHGEIDAGVGTHGYHEVSGTVCKPVGDNGGYIQVGAGTSGANGWGGPTRRP